MLVTLMFSSKYSHHQMQIEISMAGVYNNNKGNNNSNYICIVSCALDIFKLKLKSSQIMKFKSQVQAHDHQLELVNGIKTKLSETQHITISHT